MLIGKLDTFTRHSFRSKNPHLSSPQPKHVTPSEISRSFADTARNFTDPRLSFTMGSPSPPARLQGKKYLPPLQLGLSPCSLSRVIVSKVPYELFTLSRKQCDLSPDKEGVSNFSEANAEEQEQLGKRQFSLNRFVSVPVLKPRVRAKQER